jgi:UDP-N-acetylmuramate--alanine ligase
MFEKGQKIHLIGIKGVGMTALAQILKARGVVVTGSDGIEEFFTDKVLKRLKIPVLQPFSATNLPVNVDMVISSVAYYFPIRTNDRQRSTSNGTGDGNIRSNPEIAEALNRRLPILTYPEAMEKLTGEYKTVSVAGSHGKSTVTALLGWILEACKVDPTVIVGTRVNEWNANARAGKSEVMVLEADEYREAFLKYASHGAIVTSIDYDHPDYYATPIAYNHAFKQFVTGIPKTGFLVACGDDLEVAALATYAKARGVKTLTYGFQPSNNIVVRDGGVKRKTQLFHIVFNGIEYAGKIPFAGKQYVLNSAASFGAAAALGVDPKKIIKAIAAFPGTARRLEVIKKTKEYTIIDDYAHHPTAITITLEGVRRMYPDKKIICIFQPHMFSRTQVLLKEFGQCFAPADEVGIMEIFPSARETSGPVNGKDLAAQAKFHHKNVTYLPTEAAARTYLSGHAKDGNIIVLMGAGDVYKLAD